MSNHIMLWLRMLRIRTDLDSLDTPFRIGEEAVFDACIEAVEPRRFGSLASHITIRYYIGIYMQISAVDEGRILTRTKQ